MLSWLAGKMISRSMKALRAGDLGPTLPLYAEDVKFSFPRRQLVRSGRRQQARARAVVHLDDPEDGRVYENRYVIWGRIAWGKMREYEVYEDTEETRRLDQWLVGH